MSKIIKYSEAKELIKEGDVIFFHAGGFFSLGWFITGITRGKYSHVGIASRKTGRLTLIEQKEFIGGRETLLESNIKRYTKFDVYRAKKEIWLRTGKIEFTPEVAECVSQTARNTTGKKYGWKNIWDIYKGYLPFYRFFAKKDYNDEKAPDNSVCSTVVSTSYRTCYADPVPNLSDERTSPDDLSRSFLYDYQFTVEA